MTDDRQILDHPATFDIDASIAKISTELRSGFEVVARIDRPAAAMFGSARVAAGSPPYEAARAVGKLFAENGWAVVTGGGGGVMEGANRGAQEGDGLSIGFNIVLQHEQESNPYLDIEHTFDHFYARKVCFVRPSEGFVIFPGGFGTLDELYESLTLIQTGKIKHFPVVLFDVEYWNPMVTWIKEKLLGDGMISADDLDLLHLTDDVQSAVEHVLECYEQRCADDPSAPYKQDAQ
ncbi:MAG: LOG family protein [Gaiellaceae bacterium]